MTFLSHAQNFEDVILWRALRHVEYGTYIDIGAQDPVVDSVSLAFYERGWRGVHVEPVAHYADKLRHARPDERVIEALIGSGEGVRPFFEVTDTGLSTGDRSIALRHEAEGYRVRQVDVACLPLAAVLDLYRDREVHWLKIDVEGMEEQVIAGWSSSRVRPWIVVIESTVPNSSEPANMAWEPGLQALGYAFVYFDGLNRFYVSEARRELAAHFGPGPNCFDGFELAPHSPYTATLSRRLNEAEDDVTQLRKKNAELDDRQRDAVAQQITLGKQVAVLEAEIAAMRASLGWKAAGVVRVTEGGAKRLALEARAWSKFGPGSRPRRAFRELVVAAAGQILERPWLASHAKRLMARFPRANSRLRLLTYHERARSFLQRRSAPEDGNLDLYMEPRSVRLSYRRLMRARSNLDRASIQDETPRPDLPRLAYISPLPPEKSGIADYSAELLPELARFYAIDVIVAQKEVSDAWVRENCTLRDLEWFERNAHGYDRILYQFGNSLFHDHMFPFLERYPGIVVLHDFFLGNVTAHLDLYGGAQAFWAEALYHAHGYGSVRERFEPERLVEIVNKYPANLAVLEQAQGIIVHSRHSAQLARNYYGNNLAEDWAVLPLPRLLPAEFDPTSARKALGFTDEDFLVCAFGLLGATKLNQRLLEAWLETALAKDPNCFLIFVGQDSQNDEYCEELRRTISQSSARKRIRITGFAPLSVYKQYLQAADVAVQLRADSRGETSAAVLDCLAHGVPTIVNANGAMAELPPAGVIMLADEFATSELADAVAALRDDPERRRSLSEQGRSIVSTRHAPQVVAVRYHEAIESFAARAPVMADVRALAEHARKLAAPPDDPAWLTLARTLARETPMRTSEVRQLLVDVSVLAREDLRTGIQRVARSQLLALLNDPPPGFRVEPVWLVETQGRWHYRYARRYALKLLDLPEDTLQDDPVEVQSGDVFYMPDFWTVGVAEATRAGLYAEWRKRGVETTFAVYDVLPLTTPEFFPDDSSDLHALWLSHVARSADRLICISQAVADETRAWLDAHEPEASRHVEIAALHLGADIAASGPTKGLPEDSGAVLDALSHRPSFLMVGTIEPRKGYLQTLAAFDALWREGVDVNLVIVGAEGWKSVPRKQRRTIPETVERLRQHPELGRRLFWLEGISDEYLEKVYGACLCLIASSEGEGFGLPLIEAARHKIPILARDIPVFREVAGEHATYFSGANATDLAGAVRAWLDAHARGFHPRSDAMPFMTWAENVAGLKAMLLRD